MCKVKKNILNRAVKKHFKNKERKITIVNLRELTGGVNLEDDMTAGERAAVIEKLKNGY